MAITAKCTFFLSYKAAGASFTLYKSVETLASLKTGVNGGDSPIDLLWKAFMPLLGYQVQAPYVRMSDIAIGGDSEFYDKVWTVIIPTVSTSGGSSTTGATALKNQNIIPVVGDWPDQYNTSILMPLFANSRQKGRIFARFFPDSIFQNPVGLNPPTAWVNQFNTFKKALKDGQWAIQSLADEVTQPKFEIRKIFRGASGDNLSLQTYANFACEPGKTKIRVSRCSKKTYNRVYLVDSQTDATTVVLRDTAGTTVGTLANDGSVRRLVFQYPTITDADWRRATTRKAGRPFAAPVGRRKVRKLSPLT